MLLSVICVILIVYLIHLNSLDYIFNNNKTITKKEETMIDIVDYIYISFV